MLFLLLRPLLTLDVLTNQFGTLVVYHIGHQHKKNNSSSLFVLLPLFLHVVSDQFGTRSLLLIIINVFAFIDLAFVVVPVSVRSLVLLLYVL